MGQKKHKMATALIHAGEPSPRHSGAVSMPVFQTANYLSAAEQNYRDIPYIRLNNTPNHQALNRKLSAIAGGEDALVTASGMAAISATLLSCMNPGDHLIAQRCLYGGTVTLLTGLLGEHGVTVDFVSGFETDDWRGAITPSTRAIYVESLSNPLMNLLDFETILQIAREKQLISIIDNTFMTPINFRPLEIGFDLSLHSATKYLNGHSDIVAGAVIGRSALISNIRDKMNILGGSLDPHACALLHRGLKTLSLRMKAHNEGALIIASALQEHPLVKEVYYPGLTCHSQHKRAAHYFSGFSGMISFLLKEEGTSIDRFLEGLTIPLVAPSLGGVESLVTLPARTSHAGLSPEERKEMGISDTLVRLSVGIEDPEDIVADLYRALSF